MEKQKGREKTDSKLSGPSADESGLTMGATVETSGQAMEPEEPLGTTEGAVTGTEQTSSRMTASDEDDDDEDEDDEDEDEED